MKKAFAYVMFVSALMLLVSLGFWQVSRAQEKAVVVAKLADNNADYTVIEQLAEPSTQYEYKKVVLKGSWQAQNSILLANRLNKGRQGYEVFTPFKINSGQWLLVNRGWLEKSATLITTNLPTINSQDAVKGVLYRPDIGYTIGESITDISSWPVISIYLDIPAFSEVLAVDLLPLALVLDADQANAFTRIWQPLNSGPERHYGYAVQWFGLAVLLIIFGIIWTRRSNNQLSDEN